MGEVYRAKDTRLDRTVAIKILLTGVTSGEEARQRFLREAKVVSSLNHPNICALYDIGHENGVDFLVMEYIEGQTLADRLTKGALPFKELLQCAIPIADALDKAHRQGLVHRDLKPGNIMLTRDGAKLLDFGLAKLRPSGAMAIPGADPSHALTTEGTIVGTLQYMSPEQLEGREADARSDIFAFGAVLHEMATGKPAFDASSQASLIAAILMEDPPSIRDSQPLSPTGLDRTVRQCLAKNPDDRWQTAGDLKRELKWLGTDTSTSTARSDGVTQPALRTGINRWLAASLVVAVVALIGALGLNFLGSTKTAPSHRRFALTVKSLEATFAGPATVSPNGRQIIYPANGGLWLQDLSKFDAEPVPNTENSSYSSPPGMFWSPDSKWIMYGKDGKIWKQAIGSSERTVICNIPESQRIIGGCWSPSGKIVLAVWRGGLYETHESGGNPKQLLGTDSLLYHDFHTPNFLPDGKTVVLFLHAKENDKNGIGVLQEGDTTLTMLMTIPEGGGVCYSPSGHLLYTRENSNPSIWAVPFSAETLKLTGDPFLLDPNGQFPTVSDDGTMVYASNEPQPNIQPLRISLDGRQEQPLGPPVVGWTEPQFSRDARTLFYTAYDDGNWDLWKLDIERGTRTRLTSDSTIEVSPFWLPSRGGYLFNRILGVARGSLEVMDMSTGRVIEVIGVGEDISVSAGGRFITYKTDVKGNYDIWYIDAEDSTLTPHPLLRTSLSEYHAVLAPNEQWFAYTLSSSDGEQVFLRRFPDARDPIQVSIDGGNYPFWHPSGNTLFYVTDSTLMGVDVNWGDTPHLGAPQTIIRSENENLAFQSSMWSPTRNFTISPDGTYFVVGKLIRNETSRRLFIVENWFDGLRRDE